MVKRWMMSKTVEGQLLGMVRVDGPPEWSAGAGRFVEETDYAALEARCCELEAALRKIADAYCGQKCECQKDDARIASSALETK